MNGNRWTVVAASLVAATAWIVTACANAGNPPGGPPDPQPPQLTTVSPATGAVNVRPKDVLFRFDEVISESPRGAPDLAGLIFISPRAKDPVVRWRRTGVTVHPRGGFKPNTVYTVTLAPGIADLRGNGVDTSTTVVFSTGATIPSTVMRGVIFDWTAGKGAPKAIVEAIAPDSTAYITIADSIGRFRLASVPPGSYVLRGFIDGNNNRTADLRESFDTVRVQLADSLTLDLYAFVHDTLGVRIASVTPDDSLRVLKVIFDKGLAPDQPLAIERFSLKRADSSSVRIRLVRSAPDEAKAKLVRDSVRKDSVSRAEQAKRVAAGLPPIDSVAIRRAADSVAARRDSLERARRIAAQRAAATLRPGQKGPPPIDTTPPPKPSRPIPVTELFITLEDTLAHDTGHRLVIQEVRGIVGRGRAVERAFRTEKARTDSAAAGAAPGRAGARRGATPDSAGAARRDSATTRRPAADSTAVRPTPADTTRRLPTPVPTPARPDTTRRPPTPAPTPARPDTTRRLPVPKPDTVTSIRQRANR